MASARHNPIGLVVPPGTQLVRIGEDGEHSHILHPTRRVPICESGRGRSRQGQTYFVSRANQATCYRCVKLGQMNLVAGRAVWDKG